MYKAPYPFVVATLLWLVRYLPSINGLSIEKAPLEKPKVLLLSVGGFRMDYLKHANCPTLEKFIKDGTSAEYVQNSINTASLVNHYSIATGLFPESHGIVSSVMFDPKMKSIFKSDTRDDPGWWKDIHPIWQDNDDLPEGKSGVCRWPGAMYGPASPKLNCQGERESLKDDIDRVLDWFTEKDANLALLYVDNIKKAALQWGPQSIYVKDELEIFDFLMGYLLRKIRDHNLRLDILITSDHGVTDLRWGDVIDLDNYIDHKSYILLNPQGTLLFYPRHGHTVREVYNKLKKCHQLQTFLKDDLPSHYHYTHHPRIPPIVAFVPLGAVVRSNKTIHKEINKILKGSSGISKNLGGNGYDPGNGDMKSVFFANGPSFRSDLKFQAIHNTDIYGLLSHLLKFPPRPNNGSFHKVKTMFSESLSVNLNTTPPPANPDTKRPKGQKKLNGFLGDYQVRALFWFLVGSSVLMFLICAIGCVHSMWKNVHHGYYKSAKVFPPSGRQLLDDSSDEE